LKDVASPRPHIRHEALAFVYEGTGLTALTDMAGLDAEVVRAWVDKQRGQT
jgi:hypothetical protein